MTIVAWTGHRPQSLPAGFTEETLYAILNNVLDTRALRFVTGGALGIDTWAAEYAIDHGLGLDIIIPFPINVMAKLWHPQDQKNLAATLDVADSVTILHDTYDPKYYQERNIAMVDKADEVMTVWTGAPGGTGNCIRYARTTGKPIWNLLPIDGTLHRIGG